MKDKNVAGIFALFLGGFGLHRFYLGQPGRGIFYLMFCWFPLTWIIAIIEALFFFSMTPEEFNDRYNRQQESGQFQGKRTDFDRAKNTGERQVNRPASRQKGKKISYTDQRKIEELKQSGIKKYQSYDYEDAIKDFEKGLEINPNDIALHFNMACALSLNEKVIEALSHLDTAVKLGFNDFQKIREHDALAFVRIQQEYDAFEKNGFRLSPSMTGETPPPVETLEGDLLQQLNRLADLKDKGLLTREEFELQKKRLLGDG